jgi:hypothetical protein
MLAGLSIVLLQSETHMPKVSYRTLWQLIDWHVGPLIFCVTLSIFALKDAMSEFHI